MYDCMYMDTVTTEEEKETVLQDEEEFDPASPGVLFLVCKWYGKEVEVAKTMVSLYPCSF